MADSGYKGKISNASSQTITAPNPQKASKAPKVRKGGDLRSGGK